MHRAITSSNARWTPAFALLAILGCGKGGEAPSDDPSEPTPNVFFHDKKSSEPLLPKDDDFKEDDVKKDDVKKIGPPKLDIEPDPKVLAEKKLEDKKQRALQELCRAALKEATRPKAIAELD